MRELFVISLTVEEQTGQMNKRARLYPGQQDISS